LVAQEAQLLAVGVRPDRLVRAVGAEPQGRLVGQLGVGRPALTGGGVPRLGLPPDGKKSLIPPLLL
jgi:hypothetical protein